MNYSKQMIRALALVGLMTTLIVGQTFTVQSAFLQDKKPQFPSRAGHVNDFAAVLDAGTKQRVENTLLNLEQRSGVKLVVATIRSAGDQDIFDYSMQMAEDWNIGASGSKQKSLLLVIAADTGKFFTQASKSVKGDLPDGLVGEMGRRMRLQFESGEFNDGLSTGVRHFVTVLAERKGLSLAGIEQPPADGTPASGNVATSTESKARPAEITPAAVATPQALESPTPVPNERPAQLATRPRVAATPTPEAAESPIATPTPIEARKPAATPTPLEVTQPTPTPTPVSEVISPAPTPTPQVAEAPTPEPVEAKALPAEVKEPAKPLSVPGKPAAGGEDAELIEQTQKLSDDERIDALKSFLASHPKSALRTKATELIIVSRAKVGDRKLQTGDVGGGIEQFKQAIAESPADMSDNLYNDVISRFPLNLIFRGQRAAALESARSIEALVRVNPKRLLALASFYLAIEDVGEATRIAQFAVKMAPELAAAHQALGSARHIALQLDEATAEYARALELDPKLSPARRSLADLKRSAGNSQEALALYREQLQIDPKDGAARNGLILSLFDLGQKAEAEAELASALKENAQNVPLLTGLSYWHAAHNEPARALEFGIKAVQVEPRYTWAQIALARALIANKRPLEAERALRFARQYGKFSTLDYELASALASMGLYEEAADELARSFALKNGEIETRLAGRLGARAANFTDLLARERRASIFQAAVADTEANAKMLKGLLAFTSAINAPTVNQAEVVTAGQEFAAGEDPMRTYRQVYVASRLLSKRIALPTVMELGAAAMHGVEAALDTPAATVAVQADDLRNIRGRAIAGGNTPAVPDAPRTALSALLRGRIEDLTGWALFNQDKRPEALTHLRLAVGVLPEGTPLWREALWHLGAALEADGKQQQALLYYMKSYVTGTPDLIRRTIIESLYRKANGSLDGLDEKIG
ncbi:MAG: TPM domain-containing protein, partial [Pyrinomonadaceae bacterium]